ncbi:MAG: AraC family transcriptional regulator [bacterium]|nr:AraC family transcriptional regulator [bacterium]
MKSHEKFIAPESDYYVYSPSRSAMEMFFYPLQCGHFVYEPGYSLRRESYDSFLLMYIQKGRLTLEMEERTVSITAGSFVLLDCYQFHAYSTDDGWECLWCHFDGVTARHWYTNIVSRLGNVFSVPDSYPALGRLTALYNVFSTGSPIREPLLSQYLTDILTCFLLYVPLERNSRKDTDMAEKIIAYINEHFAENVTVEALARLAGLSPYYFIRIFKKETGFTPHEYLVNTRIGTAKYLLKNSRMSVKDICFRTGFSCESVFCSAFKRHLKMTPAQYRALEL